MSPRSSIRGRNQRGASNTEYILLVTSIAIMCLLSIRLFGGNVRNLWDWATNRLAGDEKQVAMLTSFSDPLTATGSSQGSNSQPVAMTTGPRSRQGSSPSATGQQSQTATNSYSSPFNPVLDPILALYPPSIAGPLSQLAQQAYQQVSNAFWNSTGTSGGFSDDELRQMGLDPGTATPTDIYLKIKDTLEQQWWNSAVDIAKNAVLSQIIPGYGLMTYGGAANPISQMFDSGTLLDAAEAFNDGAAQAGNVAADLLGLGGLLPGGLPNPFDLVGSLGNAIGSLGSVDWGAAANQVLGTVADAGMVAVDLLGQIPATMGDIGSTVASAGQGFLDWAASGLNSVANWVGSGVDSLANWVGSWDAGDWINAARYVIEGAGCVVFAVPSAGAACVPLAMHAAEDGSHLAVDALGGDPTAHAAVSGIFGVLGLIRGDPSSLLGKVAMGAEVVGTGAEMMSYLLPQQQISQYVDWAVDGGKGLGEGAQLLNYDTAYAAWEMSKEAANARDFWKALRSIF